VIKELKEKRQVLDLDLQKTAKKISQYQSYSKECPECGNVNHDNDYPTLVAPHISYGKNIMAIVIYLNEFDSIREIVSGGSVFYILWG